MESNYPRPHLAQPAGPICPACGSGYTKKVRYTWWGGVIGPGLFNLHKCDACRCQFNAKTGKPALKAIVIYNLIAFGIVIITLIGLQMAR